MTADEMLRLILTSRVYDVARSTPLDHARRLSARTGHQVFLKREDLQPIFTYKLRGAYNRIAHLSDAEKARGVITASAGNHAQGVAYAAQHLGLTALIVMPQTTPAIKVTAVARAGRRGAAGGRQLRRSQGAVRRAGRRDRPRLRPRVRRSAGDCRPGHHRARSPGQPAQRRGRDLRAGGRRRADCGHRQLRARRSSRRPGDRRRAV